MRGVDKFKRHMRRTFKRIQITARGTETDFTEKRDDFSVSAMFASEKSIAIVVVAAVKHFVDILKNGITNRNTAVSYSIKMVIKNFL